ncbi:branched-chain amino acid ABC transporter substrate-binding protein [Leucobacter sp. OLJS4]|uniref:ABC transporter substrate-binding protein n=1 Tax=unclassified Leucobacter TaxID=2621730 RepID=UPI000C184DB1|nr:MULTISPECIES: ABC transporter substrate-binding protein [unclassified Leucobacter]PIJ47749.1 branched-chain amino acid ABC transporter substrate-binding protein [Leucobacter sp. OLES1]PII83787.1 branched-chain amino acid ABC transporter substrate-binding protein [Leucobacter sp. OLCALW19]PII89320.1 branched-chain amino acid ABC transporter substrate-binding protein [Leucobacter sp. OLTLW20]PII90683.1 branched-chain amino acid ABC transporter substrate-binding protein [Leucobacter sp. OLAS13]
MKKRLLAAAALTAAAALALSGCAGSDGGGGGPIKLGSVNTISGPATFPEASQAAKAVFDEVNAKGGINGRKIEYKITDDKADPATATASARQLIGSDEVVALVGSASLLDCEINAKYYEQEKVRSIQGIGVDPGCFKSKNIAPVNIGPFNDTTLTMLYGSEKLGLSDLCVFTSVIGSTGPSYKAAVDRWSSITGKKPVLIDDTVPYGGADYTPYIVKAKKAGCKAIVSNAVEPDAIGQIKAANQQGWDDVTFLFLTSTYSESFAKAVSNSAAGVYVPAEFYPFTEDSDINADWKALMKKNDITLTSFSQGGYLSATFMVEVLKSIKGDITRESVAKALDEMKPIENQMIAYPYQFKQVAAQDYEPGGWPVVLKSGTNAWAKAADDWLKLPSK